MAGVEILEVMVRDKKVELAQTTVVLISTPSIIVVEENSLFNQFLGEQCEVEDYMTITIYFQYIASYSMIVRAILKHSNLHWQLRIRLEFDLNSLLKIRSREQQQKLWTFFT